MTQLMKTIHLPEWVVQFPELPKGKLRNTIASKYEKREKTVNNLLFSDSEYLAGSVFCENKNLPILKEILNKKELSKCAVAAYLNPFWDSDLKLSWLRSATTPKFAQALMKVNKIGKSMISQDTEPSQKQYELFQAAMSGLMRCVESKSKNGLVKEAISPPSWNGILRGMRSDPNKKAFWRLNNWLRVEAGGVNSDYSYGCLMAYMEQEIAEKMIAFALRIPDGEIFEDPDDESMGRELDPHITVKYGFHTDNLEEVKEGVRFNKKKIKATLKAADIFESKDYDVLILPVDSDDLHAINKQVSKDFNCTDTHPTYKAHATIAYLKKGEGEKYVGNKEFEGVEIEFYQLIYKNADGDSIRIKL